MKKIVVVGGSDAGISAALRARQCDPASHVTVVVSDRYPNFSICGLPFFHSGEVRDWRSLAHRSASEIEAAGVELRLDTRATRIDVDRHRLEVAGNQSLSYNMLVVATGAQPLTPSFPGTDLPGVHTLHFMESSFALEQRLSSHVRRAVIIGTGYIGLEMADALATRGLEVTVLGLEPTPLHTVDPSLGEKIRMELERRGVRVVSECRVEGVERHGASLQVSATPGMFDADLVLIAVGVRPNAELLAASGATLGIRGAAKVCPGMETSLPDVYAAGDCCETWHRVTEQYTYLPLGTTAHKQGLVAGENAVGGQREFAGSLGTQVLKVFNLAIARTGLNDQEATLVGYKPITIESEHDDHKSYYPGAHKLHFRITGDRVTGRLLGAQLLGHWQASVAKRIDVLASALFHAMSVESIADLDLSYTPPLGSPWDAVQMAAQNWVAQAKASGHWASHGPSV